MKFSLAAIGAVATLASTAFASEERMVSLVKKATTPAITDVEILNYALTLEYLEATFYAEGLKKFSAADFKKAGYPASVYERITLIGAQEKTHVSFLAGALGTAGVQACQYNFPIPTVKAFLGLSLVLETVGTSAYLGAAPDVSSKAYLGAAGSILTVEARHSSYLYSLAGQPGFPTPFESALQYSEVYTMASQFIVPGSCKGSGALPPTIKAYPALSILTAKPAAGSNIALKFTAPKSGRLYAAYINGGTTTFVGMDQENQTVRVPKALLGGITYVVVSTSATVLDDSTIVAGPSFINL